MAKGPIIKNTKARDNSPKAKVVVGASPTRPVSWSITVQQSVSHYIMKYNLKCSVSEFPYRVNWRSLLTENSLTNEFLDAFSSRLTAFWDIACQYQKLSEAFIHKHRDVINWEAISRFQKLSKNFILEHRNFLNMDIVINERFLISQNEVDEYVKNLRRCVKEDDIGRGIVNRAEILDL